jgi:hypothetical protein
VQIGFAAYFRAGAPLTLLKILVDVCWRSPR